MIAIKLIDANDDQLCKHYEQAHIKEFEKVRSSWFFTAGTFKNNPFMDEYRRWLLNNGFTMIAIENN